MAQASLGLKALARSGALWHQWLSAKCVINKNRPTEGVGTAVGLITPFNPPERNIITYNKWHVSIDDSHLDSL